MYIVTYTHTYIHEGTFTYHGGGVNLRTLSAYHDEIPQGFLSRVEWTRAGPLLHQ